MERGVDPLVAREACHREEPAPLPETVARPHLAAVDAWPEEPMVGAEGYDAHAVRRRVDLELAQQREGAVAGPLAVGHQHGGR